MPFSANIGMKRMDEKDVKSERLRSPALAGGLFTTHATWEVLNQEDLVTKCERWKVERRQG